MDAVYYDAFISYSTKDSEFVTALRLALEQGGQRVWQDVKELELTEEWWTQIKRGIFNADNFLFVASSHSLASPVCHLELEYARQLNKRLIIIRHEAADKAASTEALEERLLTQDYLKLLTAGRTMARVADQNWQVVEAEQNINIANKAALKSQLATLIEAFDLDLLHVRQGTILLGRAEEWINSGRKTSFLLGGEALREAEAWGAAGKKPEPTPQHRQFIQASRAAEDQRLAELAHTQQQIQDLGQATRRFRMASVALAGMVALALLAVVYAGSRVIRAQDEAQVAQSTAQIANTQALEAATAAQAAHEQAATATIQEGQAQATAHQANTQAVIATQQQGQAEERLEAANTQVAIIIPTVTQAAITQNIVTDFANVVLQQQDSPQAQIAAMDALVARYPEQALVYQARGVVFGEQGQSALAIQDYTQAIALNPQDATNYYNRGLDYARLGQYPQALDDYTQALALNPDYALAYNNRGFAYDQLGERDLALADYTQALRADPSLALAYNNRAFTYAGLGENDLALADYAQALLANPFYFDVYINRGFLYTSLDELDLAWADFNQAITLNPKNPIAYTNRGFVYARQGDYQSALADYEQALALDPQNFNAYNNRAAAYISMGEAEPAREAASAAIRLDDSNPRPYLVRAYSYYLTDEPALALADFEQFLALGGQLSPEIQAIYEEVKAAAGE